MYVGFADNTCEVVTLCISMLLLAGKYLGGAYPSGPDGTIKGWTAVTGSFRLPPEGVDINSVTVSVYVRPQLVGRPTPTGIACVSAPLYTCLDHCVQRNQLNGVLVAATLTTSLLCTLRCRQ